METLTSASCRMTNEVPCGDLPLDVIAIIPCLGYNLGALLDLKEVGEVQRKGETGARRRRQSSLKEIFPNHGVQDAHRLRARAPTQRS